MAVKALIEIRDWRFNGNDLEVEFEYKALNGPTQVATRSTPHSNVTAGNVQSGIKNLLITYALEQYGVTIVADEILLLGGLSPEGPAGVGYAYTRVSGSNATTTGQALVDIAGLTLPLLANSFYEFEAVLSVQSSSTAGNQYGVNYSVAGGTVEAQISGTLAAATSRSDRISALNTATVAYVVAAAVGGIRIQGIITTGANAGNLTIKHLKVTSGTATVFINSYLKALKIA
jgi:hypothetical protein